MFVAEGEKVPDECILCEVIYLLRLCFRSWYFKSSPRYQWLLPAELATDRSLFMHRHLFQSISLLPALERVHIAGLCENLNYILLLRAASSDLLNLHWQRDALYSAAPDKEVTRLMTYSDSFFELQGVHEHLSLYLKLKKDNKWYVNSTRL